MLWHSFFSVLLDGLVVPGRVLEMAVALTLDPDPLEEPLRNSVPDAFTNCQGLPVRAASCAVPTTCAGESRLACVWMFLLYADVAKVIRRISPYIIDHMYIASEKTGLTYIPIVLHIYIYRIFPRSIQSEP